MDCCIGSEGVLGPDERKAARPSVKVREQGSYIKGTERHQAVFRADSRHGLIEMRRGNSVINGTVRFNEGGQSVADLDQPAVLRIQAVGVAVLMQLVKGGKRVRCP